MTVGEHPSHVTSATNHDHDAIGFVSVGTLESEEYDNFLPPLFFPFIDQRLMES